MDRSELEAVEAHARSVAALGSGEAIAVGAFDAFFAPDDGPSYAVPARPTGDQEALRGEIAALAEEFVSRRVPLRIEMTLLLWPELPPALAATGLRAAEQTPLYVLARPRFRPRSVAGLTVRWVRPDE